MNIVIVEDEGITALFLEEAVLNLSHNVVGIFDNERDLLEFIEKDRFSIDLIFMDINIKGKSDGIETCQKIRKIKPDLDIVFITSYKDSATINRAKEISPSGYLIKPVIEGDIEAILMVVESKLGSTKTVENEIAIVDDYVFHTKISTVMKNDEIIPLTEKELLCLKALLANKNAYISSEQLIGQIWYNEVGSDRIASLRELIYRLRNKIPNLPLKSTPKVGYFLAV